MDNLINEVKVADLSAARLAQVICKIIKDDYGKHNYKEFKRVVDNELRTCNKCITEKELKVAAKELNLKYGLIEQILIKVRELQTR